MSQENHPPLREVQNPTLVSAWKYFALYDHNASKIQKRFLRLRRAILIMGVVATGLAIVQESFGSFGFPETNIFNVILRYVVILTPIIISVLLAGSIKFERGLAWILLRSSAEAIKREIYKYRARAGGYSPNMEALNKETREERLAKKVKTFSERLMKTSVNQIGFILYEDGKLPPPTATEKDDDGYSDLDPENYLKWRLDNQGEWYRLRARQFDRQFQILQWIIYFFGGVGTFLAAIGLEIWIALTNGIVTAIAAFLELRNFEITITHYNQAATDLDSVRMWWSSLSEDAKKNLDNFDKLVTNTETILKHEIGNWVQEMADVLAELYQDTEVPVGNLDSSA